MKWKDSVPDSSLPEIATWALASLTLMSVLSVGLGSAGRTEEWPLKGTSTCQLSAAPSGRADPSSLLVELDGQVVRLQGCEGAATSRNSTRGAGPSVGNRAVGGSRRAPQVQRLQVVLPTESASLLYYLPEEDGYMTGDPATD